ncbi:transposable element Tc1 transposase [Trichonephila clavipes]|nr:transposable element Tc1 transposase [Trichonephila clavipes]
MGKRPDLDAFDLGKIAVWVSVALDLREYHCSILSIGVTRLAWAREHREWSVEHRKREAWSDESRFHLLNAYERLRIWLQVHEAINLACQIGIVQSHGGAILVWSVSSLHCLGSLV